MTGNPDGAAAAASWAGALQEQLMPILDREVAALATAKPSVDDLAGIERRSRTVGVIARSAKSVVVMTPASRSVSEPEPEEDEMKHRDDSPENLERIRVELEARLDRLNATLEAKGIVVEPGCWPTARAQREPLHPS